MSHTQHNPLGNIRNACEFVCLFCLVFFLFFFVLGRRIGIMSEEEEFGRMEKRKEGR